MKKWLLRLVYAALVLMPIGAIADYTATTGSGSTVFAFVCSTTKICPAMVLIDSSNTEKATAGNPLRTDPVGTTTQPVSAASLPLPTGAASAANQPSNAAQGSTTSGQTGNLVQCAVTTSAPTYTTAQTDPVSCDTSGNVRVNVTNATPGIANNSDGVAAVAASSTSPVPVNSYLYGLNSGGSYDRLTTTKKSLNVVNGGSFYQAVAASQTATVLQSSTGATGDYLSHCVIYPTSTSPGVVTVFDNTNTAATSAILFPGGTSSISNLVPFSIPVGAVSTAGAWKVTTGANVSVVCYGKFS